MKAYTFFTDSHEDILKKHFIPSFPFSDGIELNIKHFPQECPSGEFQKDGWEETMRRKVEYVIQSIDENIERNDLFIHTDCDIIFLQPIQESMIKELGSFDVACLSDGAMLCAGFFIARATAQIRSLFLNILNQLKDGGPNDQILMNRLLPSSGVKAKSLSHEYHNVYHSIRKEWNGEDFSLPQNIRVHHANFTRGVSAKMELLKLVKQKHINAHPKA
ncbi:MAG: hypothetical protein CME70_00110 [Halobacteriovorax sp.]|nr:hypothetical protein [Halobacteriovorax sp.]|tara:strand:- start:152 stop:805 length:654 start_codon:yes stop_codon:yes gene_type:complete